MTPAELNIAIEVYVERRKIDMKERMYQAYLISRWVWQKKVDIKKILADVDNGKHEMTDEQMLATAKTLNALFGGVEKTCKP